MSDKGVEVDSSAELLASCSTLTSTSDDSLRNDELEEDSTDQESTCKTGCNGGCSEDSDSHCCVCCNCNHGKQKMRKELIRERLRKKLKLRKMRSANNVDSELQRARKLLLQRLHYPKHKHKQNCHKFISKPLV